MMEHKGYIGRVEYDEAAGIFNRKTANLCNVITFSGAHLRSHPQSFSSTIPGSVRKLADIVFFVLFVL
jgi:predicted HicB family RNase H-like nuclease